VARVAGRGDERAEFRRRVDDAVLVLFALVSETIGWATSALLDQDVERARQVIEGDRGIDERCEDLTGLIKERLLGTRLDPNELENLIALLQIVPELERSADLAEHIAQRTIGHLGGMITPRSRGLIQSMSEVAVRMWQLAGSAYRQRARDAGFRVSDADDELDELATSLVSEGVAEGADPQVAVELALIARFYERLGDHAVNLARRVDAMTAPRRLGGPGNLLTRRTTTTTERGEKRGGIRRVLHVFSRIRLVPTDEGFFDLFRAAANNARDCAGELSKLVMSSEGLAEHLEEIKAFERRGDELTVELLRRLDASFVTPYDREDIHALAEELDDVVDDIFAAASLLELAEEDQRLPELGELSDVLVSMTDEMVALVDCLQTKKGARYRLDQIGHLEHQGDAILHRGMARLFGGGYEAIEVIKLKDTVQALGRALNAIEDVSDVVESILVKNS
jgi:predicted phosphate transport protein (TIGR00153 family)